MTTTLARSMTLAEFFAYDDDSDTLEEAIFTGEMTIVSPLLTELGQATPLTALHVLQAGN